MEKSNYVGYRTSYQANMVALVLLLGDCYCNGVANLKVFGNNRDVIDLMNSRVNAKDGEL